MSLCRSRQLLFGAALLAMLAAALLLSAVRAAPSTPDPGWITASTGGLPGQPPETTLTDSSGQAMDLTISFPGLRIETSPDGYTRLSGQGLGSSGQPGAPDLPVLRRELLLPPGVEARLEVLRADFIEIDLPDRGYPDPIQPVQLPQPKCDGQPGPIPCDPAVYNQDTFTPSVPAALGQPYTLRGRRILPVEVWPAAYNPARGRLRLYSRLDLRVHLSPSGSAQAVQTGSQYAAEPFERLLRARLLNYTPPAGRSAQDTNPPRYLIISADTFGSGLADFIALKQAQGFAVTLTTLDQIGIGTSESIRQEIEREYNSADPPVYLLLVGDSDTIPAWDSRTSPGYQTDLYYTTMDGENDYIPDILAGRLPVRTTQQLQAVSAKQIGYAALTGGEPWLRTAAFIASSDLAHYDVTEESHEYVIKTHTAPAGFTGRFPLDPQPGGDALYPHAHQAESADVIAALNDSRALVTYSGHGYAIEWAGPEITQADLRALTGQPAPLVASFACDTASFAIPESFADTWIIQPGAGAVAYIGATSTSYWDEDDVLQRGLFDAMFADLLNPPPASALLLAGLGTLDDWLDDPQMTRRYYEIYHLFGDPSLELILTPPPPILLSAQPDTLAACAASPAQVQVGVSGSAALPVTLSLLDPPAGLGYSFSPNPVLPGSSSTLTLQAAGGGSYPLTIQASNGSDLETALVNLTIHGGCAYLPLVEH